MRRGLGALLALAVLAVPAPADAKPRKAKRAKPAATTGSAGTLRLGAPRWRLTTPRAGTALPGAVAGPAAPADPVVVRPVLPPAPLPDAVSATTGDRNGVMRLTLSAPAVAAGMVAVEFNNAFAEDPHDLHVTQEDGPDAFAFSALDPGLAASRDLRLEPGAYLLLCALPGHAAAGMRARLRVEAR